MADSKLFIQSLKEYEGGLSNATTDNAARNPSPCSFGSMQKIHTNKGITWSTFRRLAPKYGYKVDCSTFLSMPEDLWNKIYKNEYWDSVGGDKINSQAVAELMADKAFNGYNLRDIQIFLNKQGYLANTLQQRVDALNDLTRKNEAKLYDDLIKIREQYYFSLRQPSNIQGWLNRLNKLKERGIDFIQRTTQVAIKFDKRDLAAYLITGVLIGFSIHIISKIR